MMFGAGGLQLLLDNLLQEQIDRALSLPPAPPKLPALAGEGQLVCLPG